MSTLAAILSLFPPRQDACTRGNGRQSVHGCRSYTRRVGSRAAHSRIVPERFSVGGTRRAVAIADHIASMGTD